MAKVAVVGAGMMGSALAMPLADRGHEVRLVAAPLDEGIVAAVRAGGPHPRLGLQLPASVRAFPVGELEEALDGVDAVALGVSSAGIPWACANVAPRARPGVPLFMITKGLSWDGSRLRTLPEVVRDAVPTPARDGVFPAAIGGPCIAGELARRVPTCVALAGSDRATLDAVRELIATPYYHLFPTTDVVGVEVCAALKNAYAMGIAIASGLHEAAGGVAGSVAMHNLESAIFAQATVEMARLVTALGGDPLAAGGLPGAGDLDVTTNGGRTGRFGKLLGLGRTRDQAIAEMQGATLECLEILAVLREAVPGLVARGALAEGAMPLALHLADVALDGAKVDFPLARFFEGAS